MGGSKIGSRCGTHFSIQDYEQLGKAFCETLLDFYDQDPMKVTLRLIFHISCISSEKETFSDEFYLSLFFALFLCKENQTE